MVRAAFVPILRFSNLVGEFKTLCDLYQIEVELEEQDAKTSMKPLTKNESDSKNIAILSENPAFDQIRKRWATASRMRTFYSEMKKSISEALDKRRQKLILQEKGKQQESSEFQMIDTTSAAN